VDLYKVLQTDSRSRDSYLASTKQKRRHYYYVIASLLSYHCTN